MASQTLLWAEMRRMQLILLLFLSCILLATTQPASWDCVSHIRVGTGQLLLGLALCKDEVILNGDLTIVGINSSGLTTIQAATKKRHFRMISS